MTADGDGQWSTPIFPANYRSTYTVVRDCRFSSEHGLVYIRVLANSIAAQPYLNNANPLPVGSTVVKEEFSSHGLQPELPAALARHAQGSSGLRSGRRRLALAVGGGQPQRDLLNDKSTCIACHVRPACLARDHMCTLGSAPRGTLQLILSRQPAALLVDQRHVGVRRLRRRRRSGRRLRAVRVALRRHALAASHHRRDRRSVVDQRDADRRRLLHGRRQWPGAALRPEYEHVHAAGHAGTETLFGIWGTSAGDIWAVGGNPTDESGGGVVWHFDGITWSVVDLSALLPGGVPTLYKVWGRSATDVYAVGRSGTILHYDGAQLDTAWRAIRRRRCSPCTATTTLVVATGGLSNAVILEPQGDQFADQAPLGTPADERCLRAARRSGGRRGSRGRRWRCASDTGWSLADDRTDHGARFSCHVGGSGWRHLGGRR